MGEGLRLGVEHPHHRRGHRGGRLPAAHRHRGAHRSNAPPPSHALLRIFSLSGVNTSIHSISYTEFDRMAAVMGKCGSLFLFGLFAPCYGSLTFLLSTWSFSLSFSCSNLEFPAPAWQ